MPAGKATASDSSQKEANSRGELGDLIFRLQTLWSSESEQALQTLHGRELADKEPARRSKFTRALYLIFRRSYFGVLQVNEVTSPPNR